LPAGTQIGEGTPFTVDLTVNDDDATAIGAAEIFGHPDQVRQFLAMLDWLEATSLEPDRPPQTGRAPKCDHAVHQARVDCGPDHGQLHAAAGQKLCRDDRAGLRTRSTRPTTQFKARAIVNLLARRACGLSKSGDAIDGLISMVARRQGLRAIIGGNSVAEQYSSCGVTGRWPRSG